MGTRVTSAQHSLQLIAEAKVWPFLEMGFALQEPRIYSEELYADGIPWQESHGAIMLTDAQPKVKAAHWAEHFSPIARYVQLQRGSSDVALLKKFIESHSLHAEQELWHDANGRQLGIDDILPSHHVVAAMLEKWSVMHPGRSKIVERHIEAINRPHIFTYEAMLGHVSTGNAAYTVDPYAIIGETA